MTAHRKLMVLGCGAEQLTLIREIKRMGFSVTGCDGHASAQALSLCDEQHVLDIRSPDAISPVLDDGFDGILTTTEVALEACAVSAARFSLAGFDVQTVRIFRDKLKFARLLRSQDLACPAFAEVTLWEEIAEFRTKHEGRIVCKPIDASASRGVTILDSEYGDQKAFALAQEASIQGKVMVQVHVAGKEYGVECFVNNGRCGLLATTDKFTSGPPSNVVMGHQMPSGKHEELKHLLIPQLDRIVMRLGITRAQINFDVILDGDQAFIIDAGLRPGGNYLQELVSLCHEFNPWQFYVSIFCDGLDQTVPQNPTGHAGCRFILPDQPGRFESFVLDDAASNGTVFHQLKKKGDIIHPGDCAQNRVAVSVVSGSSAQQVATVLSDFQRSSIVKVV